MRKAIRAAAAAALTLSLFHVPTAAAAEVGKVRTDEICFTVHNPGDANERALYGVRYWTKKPTTKTRTILLVHGATPAHEYWDLRPDFSVARNLARAGYQVVAYDRLGYGRSPYHRKNGGHLITTPGDIEMTHDVVGQLREGSYTAAGKSGCDVERPGARVGPATTSVILAGNSLGGAIVTGYPGRYHDVDAAIPIGWAGNGISPDYLEVSGPRIVEAYAAGRDYVRLQPDEASCAEVFLYKPGLEPSVADVCRDGFPAAPIGEIASLPQTYPLLAASIAQVGPGIPILLVYADHDEPFPKANTDLEYAYWQQFCGCDVETWTQKDAGHAPAAHRTMPTFTAKVVDWLAAKNLKS